VKKLCVLVNRQFNDGLKPCLFFAPHPQASANGNELYGIAVPFMGRIEVNSVRALAQKKGSAAI